MHDLLSTATQCSRGSVRPYLVVTTDGRRLIVHATTVSRAKWITEESEKCRVAEVEPIHELSGLLTAKEIAKVLRTTVYTVRRAARANAIPHRVLNNRYLFDRGEVLEALKNANTKLED